MILKDKKVLQVGLGTSGGGFAIAEFLLKEGAKLTITDLKNKKELNSTLRKLEDKPIKFVLEQNREKDFKDNEIIVFNPAVSIYNPLIKLAKKYKKPFENDFTLFLKHLQLENPSLEYIGTTGTRGKTTVSFWLHHFLPKSILGGNIPEKGLLGLLKIADKKANPFVFELSSFQLEFSKKGLKAPKIAIITNFYNDHLNRYQNLKNYFEIKTKIFQNQTKNDFLILNYDDKYTKEFLKKRPKSQIYYFSLKKLPVEKNGLFFEKSKIYFQKNGKNNFVCEVSNFADHQKSNLLAAMLGSYLYGQRWDDLINKIKSLPKIALRQEIVFKNKDLKIINDSAGTNPDATIAALNRFCSKNLILITGGTDKKLNFKDLAKKIKKCVKKENLFLLEGSATTELIKELEKINYFNKSNYPQTFENLKEIISIIVKQKKYGIVLFSPASASFEKFKNEFDRGKKFNDLVKKFFK